MSSFRFHPPLPTKAPSLPFSQMIELVENGKPVGIARWSAPADASEGVIQLVDLHIDPKHRRAKHATHLLQTVIERAQQFQRLHRAPLRRIWLGVQQKSQIAARAFLTHHGFHHVATVQDLYPDQELLIYMRSFD